MLQHVDFVSTANGKTAKTFSEQGKWSIMCSWTVTWSCNTGLRKYSVTQSCPTLCNPTDCSLPGSAIHGDSPGYNIGADAMTFSRRSSQPRDQTHISYVSCTGRQMSSTIYSSPQEILNLELPETKNIAHWEQESVCPTTSSNQLPLTTMRACLYVDFLMIIWQRTAIEPHKTKKNHC